MKIYNGSLTIRDAFGDKEWFVIEKDNGPKISWYEPMPGGYEFMHSKRLGNADVEGTKEEILRIAEAIKKRKNYSANRCAVDIDKEKELVEFCSPRNSRTTEHVPLKTADELADLIEKELKDG